MYQDLDMSVTNTFVHNKNVVTIEIGLDMRGKSVYRVAWYNGRIWKHTYYRKQRDAWVTYKMIVEMITN